MKTWHPESYSQQARNLVAAKIEQFENGSITAQQMVRFTQVSYRTPIVRKRMAKMFYRYFRKHGIIPPAGLMSEEDYLAW